MAKKPPPAGKPEPSAGPAAITKSDAARVILSEGINTPDAGVAAVKGTAKK